MVYLLKSFAGSPAQPAPPLRRRTIIIGGGPTGISAAFHLGEHSLLLERRTSLAPSDPERQALFIACSSTGNVERWRPPTFPPGTAPRDEFEISQPRSASLHALIPLLRGELRLAANVVRVSPSLHLLELEDGSRFVYDKLLITLPMPDVVGMVMHELTSRISHAEFFRCWLNEYDIEVLDRATQFCEGDIDEIAAGKRAADQINRALAGRFQAKRRGSSFFEPRLVRATAATTP
jgi:hypothetical protein